MLRVASCLAVLTASALASGEPLRFVGTEVGSGGIYVYLNDEVMRSPSYHFAMPARIDVDLDSVGQTIKYNRYELTLPQPFTVTNTTTYIIPGTFDSIDIVTTVTVDPFSVAATDAGPLDVILTPPNTLNVEDTKDGSKASFPLLNVSGSYMIAGPSERTSGTFAFTMGWGTFIRCFPQDGIGIHNYPDDITIGHGGMGENTVYYGEGQIVYSGVLEGFGQEIDLRAIELRRPALTTLSFAPEPSTFTLAAFGLLGLLGFARRKRRR